MTADTIRKLDMLKRVNRFILEQPMAPAVPRATAAHAEVVTIIDALETAAAGQTTGSAESEGGVELRARTARELRAYLKNVTRTGRSIAIDHPDLPSVFRLPRTVSYPALIAQARAMIAAATPIQQSFIDAGLPATFLSEVEALLASFENATGLKQGGGITQVLNTAALKAKAALGVQAATKLDACVRNHYRNNPEMLAAWAHARRIERAPRSRSSAPVAPAISGASAGTPDSTVTTGPLINEANHTAPYGSSANALCSLTQRPTSMLAHAADGETGSEHQCRNGELPRTADD